MVPRVENDAGLRMQVWFLRKLHEVVGDDSVNWGVSWWRSPLNDTVYVTLKRPPDEHNPEWVVIHAEAPDQLSTWHWRGWPVYRAAARALHALG